MGMTEKRFQYNVNKNTIEENGKFVAYMNCVDGGRIAKKLNILQKENEQLKQFKEKVFVLLDEKIKHYEHKPFSAPVGQPMSVNFDADMDRLARLSELQDLEKELKE